MRNLPEGSNEGNHLKISEEIFTPQFVLALEKAAGASIETLQSQGRDLLEVEYETKIYFLNLDSLFRRISAWLFEGDLFKRVQARTFLHEIKNGSSVKEAKLKAVDTVTSTAFARQHSVKFADIKRETVLAIEMALEMDISEVQLNDKEPFEFEVSGIKYTDNIYNILRRISAEIAGIQGKQREARDYLVELKKIKSQTGAARKIELKKYEQKVDLDDISLLRKFIEAVESQSGQIISNVSITQENEGPITLECGEVTYSEAVLQLFRRVSYKLFKTQARLGTARNYLSFLKYHTHEEAVQMTKHLDDPDVESEKLSEMNLEKVIAFFRTQQGGEMKLKIYLQFAYPNLSEKEIDRLVIRSFKNMYGGKSITKEEEYLKWGRKLAPIEINRTYARETRENIVTISGKAPGSECVHVCGTWSRQVRVEADGIFTVTIPLKIGQRNEIRLMGIDRNQEYRSQQELIAIRQTGKSDDVEALVRLLEEMKYELAAQIAVDPGRREYLAECIERVVFKKFGQSFASGKKYMKDLLRCTKKGIVHDVIGHVLAKFLWMESMQLPNVQKGSLMFFQKYCTTRIREAIRQGKNGINLCNDPGLGKTRTVWAAVADQSAVVFTPNSVVSAWNTEASKCLVDPDLLVLDDSSHAVRKNRLRSRTHQRRVTNTKFLQKTEDQERFDLVSNEHDIVVFDEAHSRKNEHSEQSKGARKVKHRFTINVTATLARNPVELRKMLHTLDPTRPEFKSDAAFIKAFPADAPEALKSLKLLVDQYTIRFQKHEVMEEIDPDEPLSKQLYRLPKKERISPDNIGKFEMSERQADAIFELFVDWPAWCQKYGKYIPDNEVNKEDGLRTTKGQGFAKMHAFRQIINNPTFVGDRKSVDQKAWQMEWMIKKCIKEGRKPVIFCKYEAQALKYAELFKKYNPSSYTGQTSRKGVVKDVNNKPKKYSVRDGQYYEDPNGTPMSMLDYESEKFQNDPTSQLLIVTYGAGSVGTTFTAGKTMIYDDLPSDCKEDIQAEDRIHRIDPKRQTHATVQYHQMQARYPKRFLERMRKTWIRRNTDVDGRKISGWEEYSSKGRPQDDVENNPWVTAFETFFEQGTYDQVQSENLVNQRIGFHLMNDGIGDESEVMRDQKKFFGTENGHEV